MSSSDLEIQARWPFHPSPSRMAYASVFRAMAVPEIRDMILTRLEQRSDLASCARVDRSWYTFSIGYLWKGKASGHDDRAQTIAIASLGHLSGNVDRFKQYATHLKHLNCVIRPLSSNGISNAFHYQQILKPELWTMTQLLTLHLKKSRLPMEPFQSHLTPPPTSLIQVSLRILRLSGFSMSDDFLAACKLIKLRGLSLAFNDVPVDIPRLCHLLDGQKDLLALSLSFVNEPEKGYGPLTAQIGEILQLKHLSLKQKTSEESRYLFLPPTTLKNLDSLHVETAALISSLKDPEDLPQLSKIVLVGEFPPQRHYFPGAAQDIFNYLSCKRRLSEVTIDCNPVNSYHHQGGWSVAEFVPKCPQLRRLRFVARRGLCRGYALLDATRACPDLAVLQCDSEISVTGGENTSNCNDTLHFITEVLRAHPQMVELDLNLDMCLPDLAQLPELDFKPQLENLRLGEIRTNIVGESRTSLYGAESIMTVDTLDEAESFMADDKPDWDENSVAEVLNLLKDRFPRLTTIEGRYVKDDDAEAVLETWNKDLEAQRPMTKRSSSEVLDRLDEELLK